MNSEMQHSQQYVIRLARRDELTKLQAIELAAAQLFRATAHIWISDDTGMAVDDFEHWLINGKLWVAVDATDEPVGFAVAHAVDGNVYLHELDIDPKHGRQGLGARLIDTVAAWAQASGYRAVTLSTFVDVPWNAPYYRRLGFRVLGDDELGPGLREVRTHEAEVGLTNRVYMLRPVG
ncbi:GNAT family N-acetyltransferase [soil metagenome]